MCVSERRLGQRQYRQRRASGTAARNVSEWSVSESGHGAAMSDGIEVIGMGRSLSMPVAERNAHDVESHAEVQNKSCWSGAPTNGEPRQTAGTTPKGDCNVAPAPTERARRSGAARSALASQGKVRSWRRRCCAAARSGDELAAGGLSSTPV